MFTLVVNANGSWTFDLDDQLDHVDNGLNDENLLLRTSLNDLVGVPSIDFSSIVVATDRDGDEITLNAGSFTIAVQDDIPVQNAVPVAATVQEDGLNAAVDEPPAGASGNDLSTGNKEGGETDAADETSGLAGSLSGLVTVGADEPPTTSLSLASSTLPTLFSQGVAVTYSLNGTTDTLTATAGGRTVFTLVVNANGSWTFDLDDQLDHVDNGLNDENLLLRTSLNDLVGVPSIDFSSIVVATDRDGDEITLNAGSFTIAVQDDVPAVTTVPASINVFEDALSVAAGDGDLSTGILDNNADGDTTDVGIDTPVNGDEATITNGMLQAAVTPGADEIVGGGVTFALNTSVSGALTTTAGVAVTSQGAAVLLDGAGADIVGFVDLGGTVGQFDLGTDREVFRLSPSGSDFLFDLKDQLDHSPGAPGTDLETLTLDLTGAFTATDFDGDVVPLAADAIRVVVENDVPTAILPDHAVVTNSGAGAVLPFELDQDGTLANNYGADNDGGTVRFPSSLENSPSGLTSGGAAIIYHVTNNGLTLTGSTAGGTTSL